MHLLCGKSALAFQEWPNEFSGKTEVHFKHTHIHLIYTLMLTFGQLDEGFKCTSGTLNVANALRCASMHVCTRR